MSFTAEKHVPGAEKYVPGAENLPVVTFQLFLHPPRAPASLNRISVPQQRWFRGQAWKVFQDSDLCSEPQGTHTSKAIWRCFRELWKIQASDVILLFSRISSLCFAISAQVVGSKQNFQWVPSRDFYLCLYLVHKKKNQNPSRWNLGAEQLLPSLWSPSILECRAFSEEKPKKPRIEWEGKAWKALSGASFLSPLSPGDEE